MFFKKELIFLGFLKYLGVSKDNNIGFGAQGHVQKSRKYRNDGFPVLPISKSKSYYSKMKKNNHAVLLSIFSIILLFYYENNPKNIKSVKQCIFKVFPDFL